MAGAPRLAGQLRLDGLPVPAHERREPARLPRRGGPRPLGPPARRLLHHGGPRPRRADGGSEAGLGPLFPDGPQHGRRHLRLPRRDHPRQNQAAGAPRDHGPRRHEPDPSAAATGPLAPPALRAARPRQALRRRGRPWRRGRQEGREGGRGHLATVSGRGCRGQAAQHRLGQGAAPDVRPLQAGAGRSVRHPGTLRPEGQVQVQGLEGARRDAPRGGRGQGKSAALSM